MGDKDIHKFDIKHLPREDNGDVSVTASFFESLLYLYLMVYWSISSLSVIGIIVGTILPAVVFFVLILYRTDSPQFPGILNAPNIYVMFLWYLFFRKMVLGFSEIIDLFKVSSFFSVFQNPAAVFLLVVVVGSLIVVFLSENIVLSFVFNVVYGCALSLALFSPTGVLLIPTGSKFLVIYIVLVLLYYLLKYANKSMEFSYKDGIPSFIKKLVKFSDISFLLLSLLTALVLRGNGELINWSVIENFADKLFGGFVAIPVVLITCAFLCKYLSTESTNSYKEEEQKAHSLSFFWVKSFLMFYLISFTLYHYYFTFNIILLIVFCIFVYQRRNVELAFVNIILADVLIATGRECVLISILIAELIFYRKLASNWHFSDNYYLLSILDNESKKKSTWILALVSVFAIMSSFLFSINCYTNYEKLFSIGIPNFKTIVLMACICLISVAVIFVFFRKLKLSKTPKVIPDNSRIFATIVLVLYFFSCSAVINQERIYAKINISEDQIEFSYDANDNCRFYTQYYRGCFIPPIKAPNCIVVPSSENGDEIANHISMDSYYEKYLFYSTKGDGRFTIHTSYYPMMLAEFFNK